MARYNHFKEITHKRVKFSSLKIGDQFSKRDRPFKINIKIGDLEYIENKTGVKGKYFSDNGEVYIK